MAHIRGKNRIPQRVRVMVERALDLEGGVNYLRWLAREDSSSFVALIRAFIPKAIEVDGSLDLNHVLIRSFVRDGDKLLELDATTPPPAPILGIRAPADAIAAPATALDAQLCADAGFSEREPVHVPPDVPPGRGLASAPGGAPQGGEGEDEGEVGASAHKSTSELVKSEIYKNFSPLPGEDENTLIITRKRRLGERKHRWKKIEPEKSILRSEDRPPDADPPYPPIVSVTDKEAGSPEGGGRPKP